MIIKPLNVYEPCLEEKLPLGRQLEIKPGVTLVVGENEKGKTAFLKLLYSSLINSFYFEEKKLPYFLREFYSLEEERDLEEEDMEILERFRPAVNWRKTGSLKRQIQKEFGKDKPKNRFVYLEITEDMPLYPFMFSSRDPNPDEETHEDCKIDERRMFRLKRWSHYGQERSPGYNQFNDILSFLAQAECFYNRWSKVRFEVSWPMVYGRHELSIWVENEWLERMEKENKGLDKEAIGKYLHGRNIHADDVKKVGKPIKQGRLWTQPSSLTNLLKNENCVPYIKQILVPDNAEALVLIDEPTNFMSYRVKYDFLRRLRNFSSRFPNAHILVTTNDAVLIENPVEGWRYLDFNESPVKVKDKVEKPQMD